MIAAEMATPRVEITRLYLRIDLIDANLVPNPDENKIIFRLIR